MRPTIGLIPRAVVMAATALALTAAGAAAHTQSVNPNGNGDGFTGEPISRPWAMAHCTSAAPLVTAGASKGVVQFNPPTQFTTCVPGSRGN